MVNEKAGIKAGVLQLLRANRGVTSGNALSARLGTSRVAVWKHIQRLQEAGYAIESSPRGYRLRSEPDALFPWEFPGREDRVVFLQETPSTMDVAKDLARKGCPAFTVVVAGRQTRGRGRLRRVWHSEEGGLYCTLVLRPRIPVAWSPRVNFLVSLTLARILRAVYGIEAGLKWPNDILVDGRKLCGLLSEMEAEAEQVLFVNVGIGLNVNNAPAPIEPPPVSLAGLLGRKVSRREILARLLDEMEAGMGAADWDAVIPEWKRYTVTLGRPVRIVTGREETGGVAVGVDDNGALIVRKSDGSTESVLYGDCFLQG
jgi:BirA family biotin operon repressor/biotin-[acetyl-CoA-carboxylase] ligase